MKRFECSVTGFRVAFNSVFVIVSVILCGPIFFSLHKSFDIKSFKINWHNVAQRSVDNFDTSYDLCGKSLSKQKKTSQHLDIGSWVIICFECCSMANCDISIAINLRDYGFLANLSQSHSDKNVTHSEESPNSTPIILIWRVKKNV